MKLEGDFSPIVRHRRQPAVWIPAFCLLESVARMIAAAWDTEPSRDILMQISLAGLLGFGLTATWFGWRS